MFSHKVQAIRNVSIQLYSIRNSLVYCILFINNVNLIIKVITSFSLPFTRIYFANISTKILYAGGEFTSRTPILTSPFSYTRASITTASTTITVNVDGSASFNIRPPISFISSCFIRLTITF